jgi:hypothetical protein
VRRSAIPAGAIALGLGLSALAVNAQRRRPPAQPVADPLPPTPDRQTVISTLRALSIALARCGADRDVVVLTIIFRGDGGATELMASGRAAESQDEMVISTDADARPVGTPAPPPLSVAWVACARAIVREVRLPRFQWPTFRVRSPFVLRQVVADPERPR